MFATDLFHDVFGERRGGGRPADEHEAGFYAGRAALFAALQERVPYFTVRLQLNDSLRYVALARSEFDDSLHIVGGGADVAGALAALIACADEDFAPEAVIDLNVGAGEHCVIVARQEQESWVLGLNGRPLFGLADLRP